MREKDKKRMKVSVSTFVCLYFILQIFMMMSDDDDIDYMSTNQRFLDFINKNKLERCFFLN